MLLPVYLGMLHSGERVLAAAFRTVAHGHADEPDVYQTCIALAKQCDAHVHDLQGIVDRYGEQKDDEPERLHATELAEPRTGPLGLLRDLQDLSLVASLVDTTYTVINQAASALRDVDLLDFIARCHAQTETQIAWIGVRMKQAAPQALLVAR
jgi:hypothetical protein